MGRRVGSTLIGLLAMVSAGCASGGGDTSALDFTTVRPAGGLDGGWVGGASVLGGWTLLEADFGSGADGVVGEIRVPSQNVTRLPVIGGDIAGDSVRFSFRSPFGVHHASGALDGGLIFGRIEGGGLSGDFHLVPFLAPVPAVSRERAGTYSERPGHALIVIQRSNGGLAWSETEPREGGELWIAGGALYAYSADTMFTDRSIRVEPRRREWAVFRGNRGMEWHPESGGIRVTRRADRQVVQEEVAFSNGAVRLAGTLLLPPGPGPHPAAVLVHGSGPAERTALLSLLRADLLLRNGIGVLIYDKRGVGGSSGSWEQTGIEGLSGDAAAAVSLLRRHPAVARDAVGLVGHSQAGWVIPAAAALGPGADFVIVLSGGGVSPREQEVFRAGAEAVAAGLSASDASRLMELKWRYAATGEGWQEYLEAARTADPRIGALVETPLVQDSTVWTLVRQLARYDPLPDLRSLRVPSLVIFGADDDNVPIDRAAARWREALPDSFLTLATVPGVGHSLVTSHDNRSFFPAALVRTLATWTASRPWSPAIPRG